MNIDVTDKAIKMFDKQLSDEKYNGTSIRLFFQSFG